MPQQQKLYSVSHVGRADTLCTLFMKNEHIDSLLQILKMSIDIKLREFQPTAAVSRRLTETLST